LYFSDDKYLRNPVLAVWPTDNALRKPPQRDYHFGRHLLIVVQVWLNVMFQKFARR
jgi:hypothetical protein